MKILPVTQNLDREKLTRLHYMLLLIRRFEELQEKMLSRGESLIGGYHFAIGQEAVAAGSCFALRDNDLVMPSLRGRGVYLAKGVPARIVMAGCFGKTTGVGRGRWMHHHAPYPEKGILAGSGVIGADIAIATGAALSLKQQRKQDVVVDFFGDGASNTGNFHEAINLGAALKLPIVYICENNFYALSMPIDRATGADSIAARASGYGIPGIVVDGNDVLSVYAEVTAAVSRARHGLGPTLLEMQTYSWRGHNPKADADATFRPQEERKLWENNCPLALLEEKLLRQRLVPGETISANYELVKEELTSAVEWAKQQPDPAAETILSDMSYVYSS